MSAAIINSTVRNPVLRARLEALFWKKVDRRGPDECWPWLAKAVTSNLKYGAINLRGIVIGAHRVAFALANGGIAEGACIRHSCDHPWCNNPKHLLEGTQADNVQDMMDRGRHSPVNFTLEIRQRIAASRAKNRKPATDKQREAARRTMKALWAADGFREKMAGIMSGPKNPFYKTGPIRTPETTAKIVATRKARGYRHSEETREKMRKAQRANAAKKREK